MSPLTPYTIMGNSSEALPSPYTPPAKLLPPNISPTKNIINANAW